MLFFDKQPLPKRRKGIGVKLRTLSIIYLIISNLQPKINQHLPKKQD